jgi:hypothetical protein
MVVSVVIDPPPAPWGMPPRVADARRFAHYAGLAFLLAAAVHALLMMAVIVRDLQWITMAWWLGPATILHVVGAAGCFVCWRASPSSIIAPVDSADLSRARGNILLLGALAVVWFVIGAVLALLAAILLAVAWVHLDASKETSPQPPPVAPSSPEPPWRAG